MGNLGWFLLSCAFNGARPSANSKRCGCIQDRIWGTTWIYEDFMGIRIRWWIIINEGRLWDGIVVIPGFGLLLAILPSNGMMFILIRAMVGYWGWWLRHSVNTTIIIPKSEVLVERGGIETPVNYRFGDVWNLLSSILDILHNICRKPLLKLGNKGFPYFMPLLRPLEWVPTWFQ